ncbi:MAG: PAS domain S-box protein [Glaciimonas sp.]|nr:PAS domain S-box protein [Glaciimonas sp.]
MASAENDTAETQGVADFSQGLSAPALSTFFDGNPVATFVINADHIITHWNRACEYLFGVSASEMIGTSNHWMPFYTEQRPVLADLIVSNSLESMLDTYYQDKFKRSNLIQDAFEAEDFFPQLGNNGLWLHFTAAPLRNLHGQVVGAIETLQDVSERRIAEEALRRAQVDLERVVECRTCQLADANLKLAEDIRIRKKTDADTQRRNTQLTALNAKLSMAQQQLLQSEKLASIGHLAAGVAHEINNPIGYIFSNFSTLEKYLEGMFRMLAAYEAAEPEIVSAEVAAKIKSVREQVELAFLKEDIPALMRESKEGIARVRKIVQDLKDFSRVDENQEWQWANLHQGIESTLNIVSNEVKYKADVVKEYGDIPEVECLPSQINQVIMNLVLNAANAMGKARGKITIRSGTMEEKVWIEIEDNGNGISEENLTRIFDPFFTTKAIGKGTGLGLSLSYGIMQKHDGSIEVKSQCGVGATFRIMWPIHHTEKKNTEGGETA